MGLIPQQIGGELPGWLEAAELGRLVLNFRRVKEDHCGQPFLLETGIVQVGTSFSRRTEEQSDSLGAKVPLIYRTWAYTLTVSPVLYSSWLIHSAAHLL